MSENVKLAKVHPPSTDLPLTNLLGVVLVGGRSSRMGHEKAALPFPAGSRPETPNGRTFLSHAIDRLSHVCVDCVVSGRTTVAHNLPVIDDPAKYTGPIQGVASVLWHAAKHRYDGCLVTPIDMPHLSAADLIRVAEYWKRNRTLTVAFSDRIEPLVAVYPTSCSPTVQQCIDSNRRSLSRMIQSIPHATISLSLQSCLNINTPSDLDHLPS